VISSGPATPKDVRAFALPAQDDMKPLTGARAKALLKPLTRVVCTSELRAAGGSQVLLTFDDGPDAETTPAVLRLLSRYRARGIFFVVGSRVIRAPALLREILAEGHHIGNHSFTHYLDRPPGLVEYYRDVARAQAEIERACGARPRLFRPPLGELCVSGLAAARLLGLRTVLWSVDSGDWRMRRASDVRPTLEAVLRRLDGRSLHDIVLLHDETPESLALLEPLLDTLQARGVDLYGGVERL
jgi:peptidoglycan/xylan/chitin deacetylase (PgdA/CDA1 family)